MFIVTPDVAGNNMYQRGQNIFIVSAGRISFECGTVAIYFQARILYDDGNCCLWLVIFLVMWVVTFVLGDFH